MDFREDMVQSPRFHPFFSQSFCSSQVAFSSASLLGLWFNVRHVHEKVLVGEVVVGMTKDAGLL